MYQPSADSTSSTPTHSVHVCVGVFRSVQFFTYVHSYGQKHSQDTEAPSQGPPHATLLQPTADSLPPNLWRLPSISMIFLFFISRTFCKWNHIAQPFETDFFFSQHSLLASHVSITSLFFIIAE